MALLGPRILEAVGDQVANWVEKVKDGEPVGSPLEKLHETERTNRTLRQVIGESGAKLSRYGAALEGVAGLNAAFHKQTSLVDKLLAKLKWLTLGLPAALSQRRLQPSAAYIALSSYVILAVADYVDAPRLQRLNRVPGVRRVVESQLAMTGG